MKRRLWLVAAAVAVVVVHTGATARAGTYTSNYTCMGKPAGTYTLTREYTHAVSKWSDGNDVLLGGDNATSVDLDDQTACRTSTRGIYVAPPTAPAEPGR